MAGSTFRFRSWGGGQRTVTAETVSFEPAHVVFRQGDAIVLAVVNANVHDLTQDEPEGADVEGVEHHGVVGPTADAPDGLGEEDC